MENELYTSDNIYQVEKIINCRYYKNKKYYLIKWLCYPINQSTWEPKSNLKHLQYLIDDFESKYPYTIDKLMYNKFCDEIKKNKNFKNKKKSKTNSDKKLLSKKRNTDTFIEKDFNSPYYDKFKSHLHIKVKKENLNEIKTQTDDLIVDLSLYPDKEEEVLKDLEKKEEKEKIDDEKEEKCSKLIKPILL